MPSDKTGQPAPRSASDRGQARLDRRSNSVTADAWLSLVKAKPSRTTHHFTYVQGVPMLPMVSLQGPIGRGPTKFSLAPLGVCGAMVGPPQHTARASRTADTSVQASTAAVRKSVDSPARPRRAGGSSGGPPLSAALPSLPTSAIVMDYISQGSELWRDQGPHRGPRRQRTSLTNSVP